MRFWGIDSNLLGPLFPRLPKGFKTAPMVGCLNQEVSADAHKPEQGLVVRISKPNGLEPPPRFPTPSDGGPHASFLSPMLLLTPNKRSIQKPTMSVKDVLVL
jgi:hypothetical protein